MKYKKGMKVKFEDQVFEVIDECDNCKEGWEFVQRESGIDMEQICQECDGLVEGSTTYEFQKENGYKIMEGTK
tara:strand:+ start:2261 stop:2479 length:219 start_codon:yes stop_codon:yes gene_type:complete